MYTLITYFDGKQVYIVSPNTFDDFNKALHTAYCILAAGNDEYEILNAKGHVMAHAYNPDSAKAKQLEFDYEMERKAALEEERRGDGY